MAISVQGTQITFNDSTNQTTAFTGFQQIQFSLALRGSAVNSSGTPLVYNSTGNLTWTCPTGVTRIKLIVVGGGGGGGANGNSGQNGFAGGTGGSGVGIYTVTPGTAYSVTVGAAGAGSTSGGSGGAAGSSSSFGSLLTATGGGAGAAGGQGGGGANGTATAGNIIASNVRAFSATEIGGNTTTQPNVQSGGASAAQTYSTSLGYPAGAGGAGGQGGCCVNGAGGGGVSGAVYIEYVGG